MQKDLVDLENCAREPIHIPGSIQPHGILFVLKDPSLEVLQVSENCEALLGVTPDQILEGGLKEFLEEERVEEIRFALESADPRDQNPVVLGLKSLGSGARLDGVVHSYGGFHYLELEPSTAESDSLFQNFSKGVSKVTERLQSSADVKALAREAAEGIRGVTGFDRVMVYRFAAGGEGEVIAEAKAASAESFFGLWYPASDIPEQARRLYLLSPIRSIAGVPYEPAALVPTLNPVTKAPTDLSYASLRSVSPIHCEYLMNMGVTASMSVSIVCRGKLWGLIACHHNSSKFMPYELRKACTFLGQVFSEEVVRRESEQESAYLMQSNGILAKLLELMAASSNPVLGLTQGEPGLLDLIPGSGAAVVIEDKVWSFGGAPGLAEIEELTRLLKHVPVTSVFATNSLRNHFATMEGIRASASGVISLEISRNPASFILFFRPEITETVKWGGDPSQPVIVDEESARLSPRKSFKLWKEEVRGAAQPWTEAEIRMASELKKLVLLVGAKGSGGGANLPVA